MESSHIPLQPSFVQTFAHEWIAAWNSRDLDRILAHYAHDVVLTSPVAQRILQGDGNVRGIQALRDYFTLGLQAYPNIRFELIDTLSGIETIVLYYRNQHRDGKTAEAMLLNAEGKVTRVWANYNQ
jgi:ketosteroid isomerase-like protein